ncbi:MAG: response regulator [Candidatus Moranbacteria bacterium]|nr:response regulator [Candidatus Moranbacteria bacterium]
MGEILGKKVLLVEDDVFVSDVYSTRLSKEGYQVFLMNNGRDAVGWLETNTPDIVLLDIMMPYMDGIEVLKELRQKDSCKEVPVIMLTNLSEKENIREALSLGANDYLIKSHFTPSEIVTKVNVFFEPHS